MIRKTSIALILSLLLLLTLFLIIDISLPNNKKEISIKDNLSNKEIVEEIFCNMDNINTNPTASVEYNNLKRIYFEKFGLVFKSCREIK